MIAAGQFWAIVNKPDHEGVIDQREGEQAGAFVLHLEDVGAQLQLGLCGFVVGALGQGLEPLERGFGAGIEFAGIGQVEAVDAPAQGLEDDR